MVLVLYAVLYVYKKNVDLLKYLVEKEPSLINEDNGLMEEVVRQNDLKMLKYLVERNVNLNFQESTDRMTPLNVAVDKGYLEMARFLIESRC
jgi:ankyrin repeat protein